MEGFKECDRANQCEYGCWIYPGYCALREECPKEVEDFECYEIEMNEKEVQNVKSTNK